MAGFVNFTDINGTQQKLPIPDGADPAKVVGDFQKNARRQQDAQITAELPTLGDDAIPGSIDEALVGRRQDEPLIGTNVPQSIPEDIQRGVALGARTVGSVIPKAATGIADLLATGLNLPIAGASKLSEISGGPPITARLPTGSTETLDRLIDEIFPSPEGGEQLIDIIGNLALTGGAGGQAVAARRGTDLLRTPGDKSLGANILDDIGDFFRQNPRLAGAGEIGGATGAVTASELADDPSIGPTGRALATVAGGIAGGIAPTAGVQLARRGGQKVVESLLPFTKPGSELRAARRLQEASGDVEGSVAALKEGTPEGVLPARAIEDPGLQRLEAKVLSDDPKLSVKAARDLEVVEKKALTKLADDFGPGTDKAEWQQEVILRGMPKDAELTVGQPDDMIRQAGLAFDGAYDDINGFPIKTQDFQIGESTSIRGLIAKAIEDPDVFTTPEIQLRVSNRIEKRLAKLERVSPDVEGAPGVSQVDSEELLTLRQAMRAKERGLRKAGSSGNNTDAIEEADLLNNVSKALTQVLESQLPPTASASLRLTDVAYGQFKIVQGAINRSGTAGLTPEALRAQVKATGATAAQFARGETGELGRLAEVGRDASKVLGKPDEAARLVRTADPIELKRIQSDLSTAIQNKSQSSLNKIKKLDGVKFLAELEKQTATLKAAGFSDKQLKGMKEVGTELKIVQSRSQDAVETLLGDNVNTVVRFLGAVVGSTSGTRALKLFSLASGAGPSLIIAQFGSRVMRQRLQSLSVNNADELIRSALSGATTEVNGVQKSLLEALLLKPTATLRKQAQAAETIGAFLLELEGPTAETEEE